MSMREMFFFASRKGKQLPKVCLERGQNNSSVSCHAGLTVTFNCLTPGLPTPIIKRKEPIGLLP